MGIEYTREEIMASLRFAIKRDKLDLVQLVVQDLLNLEKATLKNSNYTEDLPVVLLLITALKEAIKYQRISIVECLWKTIDSYAPRKLSDSIKIDILSYLDERVNYDLFAHIFTEERDIKLDIVTILRAGIVKADLKAVKSMVTALDNLLAEEKAKGPSNESLLLVALDLAVQFNHFEVVKYLWQVISKNPDLQYINEARKQGLSSAAKASHEKIRKFLEKQIIKNIIPVDLKQELTFMLREAVTEGKLSLVKKAVKELLDLENFKPAKAHEPSVSVLLGVALRHAIIHKHQSVVEYLWEEFLKNSNKTLLKLQYKQAIKEATEQGAQEIINYLLLKQVAQSNVVPFKKKKLVMEIQSTD